MDSVFFYRNSKPAGGEDGALQELKIALQPNVSVTGWPATAGSNALAGFTALQDATVVDRLRRAGASLCGYTVMSDFGFGLGGSSAGEAVRRKIADAELVVDMLGESRLAAARADACGFKPSYGLISRFGIIGLIPSMECPGIVSGNVRQIRAILEAVAGPDELDFSLPDEEPLDFSPQEIDPQKTTLGFVPELVGGLSGQQQNKFMSALEFLRKGGFKVRESRLPDFSRFALVHRIVGSVEASSCAGRYDSVRYGPRAVGAKNWNEMYILSRAIAFGSLVKSYLFQGAFFQFERYEAYDNACRIRAGLLAEMRQLHSEADFLVIPTAPGENLDAVSLEETYRMFDFMAFANVTGQPALYMPSVGGAGIQIVGPRRSDPDLLALGESILHAGRGGN